MEHAHAAPRKDAPRKALACLLAAVLALSLAGAPVAYGAEAADGPGTEAAAAPGAAQDAGAGEDVEGGFELGAGAGEDAGDVVWPDVAPAVEGDAGGAQGAEAGTEPDGDPGDVQAAEPDSARDAEPAVGPDAGPGVEGEAGDITQGTDFDAVRGVSQDAEDSVVPPAEAEGETGDLVPLASYTIDVSAGVANGTGYTWDATTKVITFTAGAKGNTYALIRTGGQNALGIVVADGVSTTLVLKGISLLTNLPCIRLEGSARLTLTLEGESKLESNDGAGIEVTPNAALTIQGRGKLAVAGNSDAAGIGGTNGGTNGTVVIKGGTVTATCNGSWGGGAGIGGGGRGGGGAVTISGGTVTAIGGSGGGAGIGGGDGGSGGTVTISGGTVTASGNTWNGTDGAGIGGGEGGNGGTIVVNGGTVTATGSADGAGIGGGGGGGGGSISISGTAHVSATGSGGAGIGGGDGGSGGTITISGAAHVTATGGGGAGIGGGGGGGDGGAITITGGTVIATSNSWGAGIGGGDNAGWLDDAGTGDGGIITISGGTITASGENGHGAGIGGGDGGGKGGTITISGGTVTATGSGRSSWGGGAGIGGGNEGSGGTISITGGTVWAIGGKNDEYSNGDRSGAGIGGGHEAIGDPSTSVSIAPAATVRAFAKDAATPAIDAYYGNVGTGHYVLAYLETAPYPRTLAYYAAGSASRTGSVSLPADYSSFAYTTGSAVAGTHRIFAWQASPLSYLGRAERVYDSSPDIASTLNAAPVALKLNASAAARPPDWQYTVRLDANGGKVGKAASASLKRAKGSALGALPTPTRTGHTFLGWYTGKTAGTRVTASTKVTGDATYYAHWKKGVCTVRLDANGGRMPAKTASSFRRTYGTALGALPAPARANCTFLGWYTAKSKGTKVTTGTKATRSVTLYARWKANGPIVTLNANGGKVGKSARASLVRAKGAAIGKLSTPKRTGYIFKGWFTGKAKGTRVTAATKATRSVTLYAHWKAKSYTVKLNANGGKLGKSAISSTKRSYDAKFGRLATPKRTGYKFDGWYTKRSGGTKVTASTKATRAVTLYAHWKRAR